MHLNTWAVWLWGWEGYCWQMKAMFPPEACTHKAVRAKPSYLLLAVLWKRRRWEVSQVAPSGSRYSLPMCCRAQRTASKGSHQECLAGQDSLCLHVEKQEMPSSWEATWWTTGFPLWSTRLPAAAEPYCCSLPGARWHSGCSVPAGLAELTHPPGTWAKAWDSMGKKAHWSQSFGICPFPLLLWGFIQRLHAYIASEAYGALGFNLTFPWWWEGKCAGSWHWKILIILYTTIAFYYPMEDKNYNKNSQIFCFLFFLNQSLPALKGKVKYYSMQFLCLHGKMMRMYENGKWKNKKQLKATVKWMILFRKSLEGEILI